MDDVSDRVLNVFESYYRTVRPANAADWLGLNVGKDHFLTDQPPWGAVFPWRARFTESYRNAHEQAAVRENKSVGIQDTGIEDGWLFCGPVSKTKLEVEAKRIVDVVRSISKRGHQRSNDTDGDARATALVREDGEWRWLLTAGKHPASGASALGYEEIPIRVNLVISRSHVSLWPYVV